MHRKPMHRMNGRALGACGVFFLALLSSLPAGRLPGGEEEDAKQGKDGTDQGAGLGEPSPARKDRSEPLHRAVFEPAAGEAGRIRMLPRGEVLLFAVLQGLADVSGGTVHWRGTDPPETKLLLARSVDPFDEKSAIRTLEGAGFQVKASRRGGRAIYDVEKAPPPPRTKGKLIPSGEGGAKGPAGTGEASPPPPTGARAATSARLYELHEGAGSRYVVILETDSREEAEDALKLLDAHRKSRAEGRKTTPPSAQPPR